MAGLACVTRLFNASWLLSHVHKASKTYTLKICWSCSIWLGSCTYINRHGDHVVLRFYFVILQFIIFHNEYELYFIIMFGTKLHGSINITRWFVGCSVYILLVMLLIDRILYDFFGEVGLECSTQCVFVDEVGVKCSTQCPYVSQSLILGY